MSSEPRTARPWGQWMEHAIIGGFLLFASVWVVFPILRDSLGWRYFHDTPILMYIAFLIDHYDFVPYRDTFDMNLLGAYLSYQAVGHFLGWDYPSVRLATLIVLIATMAATCVALRRLGLRAVWAVALIFPLIYFRQGNGITMQREFIALLPMMIGVAAASFPRVPAQWRALIAGFAFGLAATIKPHMAIGLACVVVYLVEEEHEGRHGWRAWFTSFLWNGIASALGFALPLLAFLGYLLYYGVLDNFLDSALGYLPLYGEITGDRQVLPKGTRLQHILINIPRMGENWQVLVIGFAGLAVALGNPQWDRSRRRLIALLWMLLLAYIIYPAFSGQFWHYHYLPMMFICSVGAGLAFAAYGTHAPWQQRFLPAFMILVVLVQILQPHKGFAPVYEKKATAPEAARIDSITEFLKENLRPGDTVQPLDWAAGGMCHAMLQARAKIATPFVYYFHFFHHVDTPYIQKLRARFITEFEKAKPRFVLEAKPAGGQYIKFGPRAARSFPDFELILKQQYVVRKEMPGYVIHERKPEGENTEAGNPVTPTNVIRRAPLSPFGQPASPHPRATNPFRKTPNAPS